MDKFVIRTVTAIYAKIANIRISPPPLISKANFAHATISVALVLDMHEPLQAKAQFRLCS